MMAGPSAEEFFAQEFATGLPGYQSRKTGDRDLLAKTKTALLQAIEIVEGLPQSHWVWQPGYAIQTVSPSRLRDFCTFRLRENPDDGLALWTRVGLAIHQEDPDFGRPAFDRLRLGKDFDVAWPVYAACFIQRAWAASQSVGLGPFLRQTDLLAAAGPTIAAIRERRDPYVDVFETEDFTREYAAECIEISLWEAEVNPPASA